MNLEKETMKAVIKTLAPTEAILFIVLAVYANHKKESRVALNQLVEDTKMSRSTVRRIIKRLEAIGAVEVEPQHHADGSTARNIYRLCLNQEYWRERAAKI